MRKQRDKRKRRNRHLRDAVPWQTCKTGIRYNLPQHVPDHGCRWRNAYWAMGARRRFVLVRRMVAEFRWLHKIRLGNTLMTRTEPVIAAFLLHRDEERRWQRARKWSYRTDVRARENARLRDGTRIRWPADWENPA